MSINSNLLVNHVFKGGREFCMLSKELLDDSVSYKLVGLLNEEPVSLTDNRVSMGVVCIMHENKISIRQKERKE